MAVKKGHNYMAVVLDCDIGWVVWMGQRRQMAPTARNAIRAVLARRD